MVLAFTPHTDNATECDVFVRDKTIIILDPSTHSQLLQIPVDEGFRGELLNRFLKITRLQLNKPPEDVILQFESAKEVISLFNTLLPIAPAGRLIINPATAIAAAPVGASEPGRITESSIEEVLANPRFYGSYHRTVTLHRAGRQCWTRATEKGVSMRSCSLSLMSPSNSDAVIQSHHDRESRIKSTNVCRGCLKHCCCCLGGMSIQ
ncbi:hypothetical protein J8273_7481 [Carpediemonas membranifera]|uniref:Uncharacterized protein n=1 Tax=Carpediemonas membranifera TaxID=201153 RepID=A0A8J6E1X9_9EUKA|nr:hypothetical protein J8273_7481 [Carpediemonas membranifera]|eukprot:KAG9391207.1 hypothetical protein J8273_7481 [Carpediemonas membranifera]